MVDFIQSSLLETLLNSSRLGEKSHTKDQAARCFPEVPNKRLWLVAISPSRLPQPKIFFKGYKINNFGRTPLEDPSYKLKTPRHWKASLRSLTMFETSVASISFDSMVDITFWAATGKK